MMKDNAFYTLNLESHPKYKDENISYPTLLVIKNGDKIVVSELDCVHSIESIKGVLGIVGLLKEPFDDGSWSLRPILVNVDLSLIDEFVGEEILDLSTAISYFNIKSRVGSNYCLLQQTCKEVGISYSFPPWRYQR